ncbi:MAG: aminotransferase class I/II-fold pyridoxal phosphate-dependent enzyme, partial [Pseudomonadota bacterium]
IGAPGYPSYRQILRALSLTPVDIETQSQAKFQPTPQDLNDQDLAGLLVASPANPTGSILSQSELQALADWAAAQDAAFISDEIYHGIAYDAAATTALSVTDRVYVINSFSKYFSMTGWRIGWMVVPPDHVRMIERLAQNMFICPPHASQIAALAALDAGTELDANVDMYRANRALMLDGLRACGITDFVAPDGAFYIYANVSHLTDDSLAFASEVLHAAGVAITPGLDFDKTRGHGWVRFSYARSTSDITEGLHRITSFLETR